MSTRLIHSKTNVNRKEILMQSTSDTHGTASPCLVIDYKVTPKIVYGKGRIVQDGKEVTRELMGSYF